MIAPSGTGRNRRPMMRQGTTRSQWRKLALLWTGALALLVVLMVVLEGNERRYFFGAWIVLALPLVILTAIRFSERDMD